MPPAAAVPLRLERLTPVGLAQLPPTALTAAAELPAGLSGLVKLALDGVTAVTPAVHSISYICLCSAQNSNTAVWQQKTMRKQAHTSKKLVCLIH
jgi:hypothetical protein